MTCNYGTSTDGTDAGVVVKTSCDQTGAIGGATEPPTCEGEKNALTTFQFKNFNSL